MKEIRAGAVHSELEKAILDSVASPKICLTRVLSRLQLKGEGFNVVTQEAIWTSP